MKKSLYIIILLLLFLVCSVKVDASSGFLKKASIKTCNGVMYGQHSSDNHWHVAEEKNGKYYAAGDPFYTDPCTLSNTPDEDDSSDSEDNNNQENNQEDNQQNPGDNSNNNDDLGNTDDDQSNSSDGENKDDIEDRPIPDNKHEDEVEDNTPSSPGNVDDSSNNEYVPPIQEELKSNDNSLKSIIIDGKNVEIKDNITYSTTNDKVDIKVTTADDKASYEIKNNSVLNLGNNIITIEVKAEDGTIKIYTVNVNKKTALSSDNSIKIIVNGEYVVFDNFNIATIYVGSFTNNVSIDYELSDDKATVEIPAINNLETGDNILEIKVAAEDGSSDTYQLIIHKYTKTSDLLSTIFSIVFVGVLGFGIYLWYFLRMKKGSVANNN